MITNESWVIFVAFSQHFQILIGTDVKSNRLWGMVSSFTLIDI